MDEVPTRTSMSPSVRVRALSIHATYGCRHSGACCRAGWRIPVEPDTEDAVASLVTTGALTLTRRDAFERADGVTVTAMANDGACVFLEAGSGTAPPLCAIHRLAGQEVKPMACRQFPRVALHDPRGVSVTLSHFCPTAADLLFEDVPLAIVNGPIAFPPDDTYEGLNALDTLPPLIKPGMLMDLESYDAFERHMVAVFARSSAAMSAIDQLAADVEDLRAWKPAHGPLVDAVSQLTVNARSLAHGRTPMAQAGEHDVRDIYARLDRSAVAHAMPSDLQPRAPHGASPRQTDRHVVRWDEWEPVLCRYLAARAFASWMAYQGRGLRTAIASLYVALDLVKAEADTRAARAGHAPDRPMLREAIRQADLQFVHLADSQRLADALGRVEHS